MTKMAKISYKAMKSNSCLGEFCAKEDKEEEE